MARGAGLEEDDVTQPRYHTHTHTHIPRYRPGGQCELMQQAGLHHHAGPSLRGAPGGQQVSEPVPSPCAYGEPGRTAPTTTTPALKHRPFPGNLPSQRRGGGGTRGACIQVTIWRVSTAGCGLVQSAKVRYGSHFHRQKVVMTRSEPCSSRSTPPLGY